MERNSKWRIVVLVALPVVVRALLAAVLVVLIAQGLLPAEALDACLAHLGSKL